MFAACLRTAEQQSYQLLQNTSVQAAIAEAMKARSERTQITQDRVLTEYAKLAFLDPRQFFGESGALIPGSLLPAEVAAALARVDVTESYDKESQSIITTRKIRFADKKAALDSVARHLGMFIEKHEVTCAGGKDVIAPVAPVIHLTIAKA